MPTYLGDFDPGDIIYLPFTTVTTTGGVFTWASAGVAVYKDGELTETNGGVTLTTDFDGRTGFNIVTVATAFSASYYAVGGNFHLVATAGTVQGTSIAGYVLGLFSIGARSALRPTSSDRTLDVTATGGAGVDWSNIENQGTTVALTATTIAGVTNEVGVNWGRVANQTAAVNLTATTVGGVTALGTAAIWAGSIVAAAANKIADFVLRRSAATTRASADGDAVGFRSLLGAISKLVNRVAESSATNLRIYEEDDLTAAGNQTITTTGTAVTWTDLNTTP